MAEQHFSEPAAHCNFAIPVVEDDRPYYKGDINQEIRQLRLERKVVREELITLEERQANGEDVDDELEKKRRVLEDQHMQMDKLQCIQVLDEQKWGSKRTLELHSERIRILTKSFLINIGEEYVRKMRERGS
jgi:hypothetical protein